MSLKEFEEHKVNQKRPKRIILIRSGESEKDSDLKVYQNVPDNKVKLTKLGIQQSIVSGRNLKKLIGNESVFFYVSPLQRSVETFENISKSFVPFSFLISKRVENLQHTTE
jgi:broad specificity phosphatase PhoE